MSVNVPTFRAQVRAKKIAASKPGGGPGGLLDKQTMQSDDLLHRPQFVRVHLPKDTRPAKIRERSINHLDLAIPELTGGFAIKRDLRWKTSLQFLQVFRGTVRARGDSSKLLRNRPATARTPGGVVTVRCQAFDNVPVPGERQGTERLDMVANEWQPVYDNRKEVNRQWLGHQDPLAVRGLKLFPTREKNKQEPFFAAPRERGKSRFSISARLRQGLARHDHRRHPIHLQQRQVPEIALHSSTEAVPEPRLLT